MKFRLYLLLLFIISTLQAQVTKVEVNMSEADLLSLFKRDLFSKDFLGASVNISGSTYSDAKIRMKGSTTPYYPKRPFRIKLGKKGQLPSLFGGMRHMNFNPMYTDKSFMREKLVWDIYQMMGGFGPKAYGYTNLFINGVDNGLYLMIQHIDEDFLKDNSKPEGDVFEAEEYKAAGDLKPIADSFLKKTYEKHVGDENDYEGLKELISKINSTSDADFAQEMKSLFDMNSVYNWFVLNTITMQGDTWVKNYYLYKDPSKTSQMWSLIPWDYDMSFGRDGDEKLPYPQELLNDLFSYSYEPLAGPPNVLKERIMKDPVLFGEYKERLRDVLLNVFTEDKLFPEIDRLTQDLDSYVRKEPIRWGTYQDFRDQTDALKYFITARRNYLLAGFLNPPQGENDEVELSVSSTGVPYNFVDRDGKLVGIVTFTNMSGLRSVTLKSYPSKLPPGFPDGSSVKRYFEIIPNPGASFSATVRWEYLHGDEFTEVPTDVYGDLGLHCYKYNGSWNETEAYVNSFGNYVTMYNITDADCGEGKYFGLKQPDTDTKWSKETNLYWHRWNDAAFENSSKGIIAGDDGTVLITADGGETFQRGNIGIHTTFYTAAHSSGSTYFAAGMFGLMFKSDNGGSSWSQAKSPVTFNINKIRFANSNNGWGVCDRGTVIITNNGGSSWTTKQISETKNLYALAVISEEVILAGGDNGRLYRSEDGGKSWNILNSSTTNRIYSLIKRNDNEIWGSCEGGSVIYSTDNGNSWNSKEVATGMDLFCITASKNGALMVSGENGITAENLSGTEWTITHNNFVNDMQCVVFSSAGSLAFGNWGSIFRNH